MIDRFMKTFKSISSNQKGFSYMEIMVSLFVVGITSVGVMKLSDNASHQSIFIRQNFDLDTYASKLRNHLENKTACNSIITGSGSTINVDLSSFNSTYPEFDNLSGLKFIKAEVLPPDLTGVSADTLVQPIDILVHFNRGLDELNEIKAVRKISLPVEFDVSENFVGCSSYDEEAQRAAFKLSCEMLEGDYSYNQSSGDLNCDFTSIPEDGEFMVNIAKTACEELIGAAGSYSSGICDQINKPALNISSNNFGPGKLSVSGGTITSFSNQKCGEDEFVKKINADGSVECIKISKDYCNPCQAGCEGSLSKSVINRLCVGATTVSPPPSGPCDSAPKPSTVCLDEDLVPGYPTCGQGTKADCVPDVCAGVDPADVCVGVELVPGEACGEGTKIDPSCNSCWNTVNEISYGATQNPDFKASGSEWTCDGSSQPATYTSTAGPCDIGTSCTWDGKNDKKQFVCQNATATCKPATPVATVEPPVKETQYRVDCGGYVRSGSDSESGLDCGVPHGTACTASDLGKSYGSIQCKSIREEYGRESQGHGTMKTSSCTCVSCDNTTQTYFSSNIGFSHYACDGRAKTSNPAPSNGGNMGAPGFTGGEQNTPTWERN